MRDGVNKFAMSMEKKMSEKDKDYGGSWEKCPIQLLRTGLVVEYGGWMQLKIDNPKDHVSELGELVDIANRCMMLWNRLKDASPLEEGEPSEGDKSEKANILSEVVGEVSDKR